ncbi:cation-transporting P-type ATPase [Weissella oryzae SG25]|uniref:Cation-transporting P-type ATPase n=1 Tax=Weissella oryzae (strain DSM 25784 / JCM 18191 / LMG 30913 / SG25) TaxID=1329250 RepID=A0A069CUS4_WEIOS|nr:heavy metal translocating P-type ATPase [Weissella oryzae]GAK31224.1 cation-transporting P-type ATPase [Weissella oryzae SG25]
MKKQLSLYFAGLGLFFAGLAGEFLGLPKSIIVICLLLASILAGYHIVFEGFSQTWQSTREKRRFTPNIHLLMSIGAFGAILIGDFFEAALLILIFAGAHFLEDYSEGKSRREISNLLALTPVKARQIQADGQINTVDVTQLQVNDQVQVPKGGQIPIDGRLLTNQAVIDEATINGESMPREKQSGDEVFAGTINLGEGITLTVTRLSKDTVFAKILQLVEQSQTDLSRIASKIQRFEPIYVTVILGFFPLVILMGVYLFGWTWSETLYRSIIFLISASPCALAVSAIPATLAGLSNAAKQNILFKGGSFLAGLSELKVLAFDKTGTLTNGQPEVTDFHLDAQVEENLLKNVIFSMESQANHPLAAAIVRYLSDAKPLDLTIQTTLGEGLTADYANVAYQIGKPALFTKVPEAIETAKNKLAMAGKTVIYIAANHQVVGYFGIMDEPNQAANAVIKYLGNENVHTVMLTGDAELTASAIAKRVGIDEVIANVLPAEKLNVIKQLQAQYGAVGMVGDGVNDAPALVGADIGIAMGNGTDVAVDVADMVLMKNDLVKLRYAYRLSKRLKTIVWENIIFALLIVVALVILNFLGLSNITFGVFAHEGSTILVILNGLRMLFPLKK